MKFRRRRDEKGLRATSTSVDKRNRVPDVSNYLVTPGTFSLLNDPKYGLVSRYVKSSVNEPRRGLK